MSQLPLEGPAHYLCPVCNAAVICAVCAAPIVRGEPTYTGHPGEGVSHLKCWKRRRKVKP